MRNPPGKSTTKAKGGGRRSSPSGTPGFPEGKLPDENTFSPAQKLELAGRVLGIIEQGISLMAEKERTRRAELYTRIRLRELDVEEAANRQRHDEAVRQLDVDLQAMLKSHEKEMEIIRRDADRSIRNGQLMKFILELRAAELLTHEDLVAAFRTLDGI